MRAVFYLAIAGFAFMVGLDPPAMPVVNPALAFAVLWTGAGGRAIALGNSPYVG